MKKSFNNTICIKGIIGSCRPGFNPQYRQNFSFGIFQDLSTLIDLNWIVSMKKSDLIDTCAFKDSTCGQSPTELWYRCVHCKAAAKRSNVIVSGKK
jgi:hypothetical protein